MCISDVYLQQHVTMDVIGDSWSLYRCYAILSVAVQFAYRYIRVALLDVLIKVRQVHGKKLALKLAQVLTAESVLKI